MKLERGRCGRRQPGTVQLSWLGRYDSHLNVADRDANLGSGTFQHSPNNRFTCSESQGGGPGAERSLWVLSLRVMRLGRSHEGLQIFARSLPCKGFRSTAIRSRKPQGSVCS
jgi:hypothetical protein